MRLVNSALRLRAHIRCSHSTHQTNKELLHSRGINHSSRNLGSCARAQNNRRPHSRTPTFFQPPDSTAQLTNASKTAAHEFSLLPLQNCILTPRQMQCSKEVVKTHQTHHTVCTSSTPCSSQSTQRLLKIVRVWLEWHHANKTVAFRVRRTRLHESSPVKTSLALSPVQTNQPRRSHLHAKQA